MAATPYKPVSFTGETISQNKMQQLANNQQWLFENGVRTRYSGVNLVRDSGLKIISGKSIFNATSNDATNVVVHFGNFFTMGCNPIVTVTVQTSGHWLRKFATIRAISGVSAPIDHTGFIAHITTHERWVANQIEAGGWLHWTAVGY